MTASVPASGSKASGHRVVELVGGVPEAAGRMPGEATRAMAHADLGRRVGRERRLRRVGRDHEEFVEPEVAGDHEPAIGGRGDRRRPGFFLPPRVPAGLLPPRLSVSSTR